MNRILAISDIHGELALFEELLLKASYNPEEDQLFLLGDYIDRGPASSGVLNLVSELQEKEHEFSLATTRRSCLMHVVQVLLNHGTIG